MTVKITINEVVVNIVWRASNTVLRMANAKDMAPRKPVKFTLIIKKLLIYDHLTIWKAYIPAKNSKCWKLADILGLRFEFKIQDKGYMLIALPMAAQIYKFSAI